MNRKEKKYHHINRWYFYVDSKKASRKIISKYRQLKLFMTKNNIIDFAELLGNRKEMFLRNFFSGILNAWNRN